MSEMYGGTAWGEAFSAQWRGDYLDHPREDTTP